MKKHVVLAGKKNAGKTTTVNRLLEHTDKKIYGYFTEPGQPMRQGFRSYFMRPAGSKEWINSDANHIGDGNGVNHFFYPETFNKFGVDCLTATPDGLIVMDELGFMELEAEDFCNKVLECLDGDIPVLATAKAGHDVEFLNNVLNHPNAEVFFVYEENRDEIYEKILSEWDGLK